MSTPHHIYDAEIFERIADLKAAWLHENDLTDEDLTDYLERNFNAPERKLRDMRPTTVAGALAKLEFFKWDGEVSGSDEPLERGIDIAIEDLKALLSSVGTT